MKKTTKIIKQRKNVKLNAIIYTFLLIFGIIILFMAIYQKPIIIGNETINVYEENGELLSHFDNKIIEIIYISFVSIIFIIYPITGLFGSITGSLRARRKIKRNEKIIKSINPYTYYRELPNNYGIGMCTLLIDSSIENEKDIVATILDLCAKKYLKLEKIDNKYKIHILKDIDDKPYLTEEDIKNNLYLNEKYILANIKNNTLRKIDYNEWYSLCLKDGENNKLFYDKKIENPEYKFSKSYKLLIALIWITTIIIFANIIISRIDINNYKDIEHLLSLIVIIPMFLLATYMISSIIFAIIIAIKGIFKSFIITDKYFYNSKIGKRLVITEKGKQELQKLYAFENFLNDFSIFAKKNPEEIILWDRYLSYAGMFGITKNILKSGYNQLINNSSFTIDNIDNINIKDIQIE